MQKVFQILEKIEEEQGPRVSEEIAHLTKKLQEAHCKIEQLTKTEEAAQITVERLRVDVRELSTKLAYHQRCFHCRRKNRDVMRNITIKKTEGGFPLSPSFIYRYEPTSYSPRRGGGAAGKLYVRRRPVAPPEPVIVKPEPVW